MLHSTMFSFLQVYRVHYLLAHQSSESQTYQIASPSSDELYSFNGHGQLINTQNVVTQTKLYQLHYRTNAIRGWLSRVDSASGDLQFHIHRDTQGNLLHLRTPTGQFLLSYAHPPS